MPEHAATGETIFRGIPVSTGVCVGKILILGQQRAAISRQEISESDVPHQLERLEQGLLTTRQQLHEIQQQVTQAMGAKDASIFEAHVLVLDDPTLLEGVTRMIAEEKVTAEWAFHVVAERFAKTLEALPDDYLRERIADLRDVAARVLPDGIGYEWTDLSFQEVKVGRTGYYIFLLSELFVFLALAAQYESWSLPLAIMLIVPMCLLSAVFGVWLHSLDINVLTQIGFVVLIGLAAKNAILIVEFARQIEDQGKDIVTAAVEACRLRLRPILMTSLAFALGVLPLYLAKGAGAELRIALGTAVFWGMLGVTLFGLFLIPVFYVVLRGWALRRRTAA